MSGCGCQSLAGVKPQQGIRWSYDHVPVFAAGASSMQTSITPAAHRGAEKSLIQVTAEGTVSSALSGRGCAGKVSGFKDLCIWTKELASSVSVAIWYPLIILRGIRLF